MIVNRRRAMGIADDGYIHFEDPEVVRVLTAKGVIPESGGITIEEANDLPVGNGSASEGWWKDNTTIREFDEIKYLGRLKNGSHQMGQWFFNATNLESVDLTGFTRLYGRQLFENCKNLEYFHGRTGIPNTLNLPDLTKLDCSFKGCTKLTSIVSLGSITSIGGSTFENCTNLATINFPSTITSVGTNAFKNTAWFNNQPNGEVIISSCLYKYKGILTGSYSVPNGITYITAGAYADTGITSLTIPDTVTYIGNEAFVRCSNLTSVNLGNGVVTLDGNVFVNCTSLTSITLPDSVTTLNSQPFRGCTALETLVIGSGVNNISGYQFPGCSSLSSITVSSNSTTFDSRDNCNAVIKSSTNELVLGCKDSVIPNTVTKLGERAFNDVKNLTSIVIPNSVTIIGKYCFAGCRNMTTVTISGSVLTSIEEGAFNGCTGLTSVTINATTPPTIYSGGLTNTNNCPIYVPAQSVSAYKSASGWSTYADRIQAIST